MHHVITDYINTVNANANANCPGFEHWGSTRELEDNTQPRSQQRFTQVNA